MCKVTFPRKTGEPATPLPSGFLVLPTPAAPVPSVYPANGSRCGRSCCGASTCPVRLRA